MKIPLQITDGLISTIATIRAPKYHINPSSIKFYVDTGSPETFLSERDALRLNVPISKLSFNKHIRIGGTTFEALKMEDIILYFKTEDSKTEMIRLPLIQIINGSKQSEEERMKALSTPSLLGTDFLLKNKFALYCNPYKNVAFLEKIE